MSNPEPDTNNTGTQAQEDDAIPVLNSPGPGTMSPYALVPMYVCHLLFLVFLLVKLDYGLHWAWQWVFLPIALPDVGSLVLRALEIRRGLYPTPTTRPEQKEVHTLLRLGCSMVDGCGAFTSKWLVALGLEGVLRGWPLLKLLLPLWITTLASGLARCVLPPPDRVRQTEGAIRGYRLSQAMIGFAHFLFRGLQPLLIALRVDGHTQASWFDIFVPAWILLLCFGLLATTLFNCAPLFTYGANRGSEVYQRMKYLMILYSLQFYLYATTLFFFLYQLAKRLDCKGGGSCGISLTQIMLPLMFLYFALLFLNPLVVRNSLRYQAFVQDMYAQIFDPSAAVHVDMGENLLSPLNAPTWLTRQTDTLYRRPSEKELSRLGVTVINVAECPKEQDNLSQETNEGGSRANSTMSQSHYSTSQVMIDLSRLSGSAVMPLVSTDGDIEAGIPSIAHKEQCCVCLTNLCNAVLMECGHAVTCYTCGQVVAKRRPGLCPICRTAITQVLKVEDSDHRQLGNECLVIAQEGFVVSSNNDNENESSDSGTSAENLGRVSPLSVSSDSENLTEGSTELTDSGPLEQGSEQQSLNNMGEPHQADSERGSIPSRQRLLEDTWGSADTRAVVSEDLASAQEKQVDEDDNCHSSWRDTFLPFDADRKLKRANRGKYDSDSSIASEEKKICQQHQRDSKREVRDMDEKLGENKSNSSVSSVHTYR